MIHFQGIDSVQDQSPRFVHGNRLSWQDSVGKWLLDMKRLSSTQRAHNTRRIRHANRRLKAAKKRRMQQRGALAWNLFFRTWQYRREHWVSRAGEFLTLVTSIAKAASDYWCDAHSTELSKNLRKHEAEILGLQSQLDGLFVAMDPYWDSSEREHLQKQLTAFHLAVAGGEFQSSSTIASDVGAERARLVHARAADVMIAVRNVVDDAVRFSVWNRAWRRPVKAQSPFS